MTEASAINKMQEMLSRKMGTWFCSISSGKRKGWCSLRGKREKWEIDFRQKIKDLLGKFCVWSRISSEHLVWNCENKALLTSMVKTKVLLVPFGWILSSGMMLGHHKGEADDLHSHPVSPSINKRELSILQGWKHRAIGWNIDTILSQWDFFFRWFNEISPGFH